MATITRRGFMDMVGQAGVIGLSRSLFPAWMPRLAFRGAGRAEARGDVLVTIFQRGGMDGLSAVIPYGDGRAYYDKRPTISVPEPGRGEGAAIDLNGHFGLHPALRPLHDIYQAKRLAVVHASGSPDPTRSHFNAMEFMESGKPGDRMVSTGWINRHLQTAAWQNDSPFRAVGMGALLQGSLRGPVSTLAFKSITDFHLGGREDQLTGIQETLVRLYSINAPEDLLDVQAREVFSAMQILERLSVKTYTPENGAVYPQTDFGRGLKQTAQLIKADVGLEVSCVDIGGWDTHESQGGVQGQLATILTELAQGLSAFSEDLGERTQQVTVVTMSEFGRRVAENASKGTDHGHGNCMFVMGGGVNGGVYTRWPGLADDQLNDGDLAITTDYRDVLAEILTARLLNPALDQIFPGYKSNPLGILQKRRA
jgi:uncharacterized protein (DUF1501 family)